MWGSMRKNLYDKMDEDGNGFVIDLIQETNKDDMIIISYFDGYHFSDEVLLPRSLFSIIDTELTTPKK